jgi:hypothetical protein
MKSLKTTMYASLLLLSLIACKKEEDKSSSTNQNPTPTAATFEWQENGGPKLTADSAFWTTGAWGTGIRAYKGGMENFFEINWSGNNNSAIGAKVISSANYGFTFLKGGTSYSISTDQNLNITAVETNTITGNFNMNVTGGTISTISANFSALPKK